MHDSEVGEGSGKAGALTLPFMAGYGALVLAFHWPACLEGYGSWVFGSYGLYVWGVPVQQLLIMAGANTQSSLTATAPSLTYLCGWLSCRYIEAPTLCCAVIFRAPNHIATLGLAPFRIRASAPADGSSSCPSAPR